ncbi:MAG: lysine--tRNA ligase [bacterium]
MDKAQIGQSLEQMRQFRIAKAKKLRDLGFEPYPARSKRTSTIDKLVNEFTKNENKDFYISGRLSAFREHGKLAFGDLTDTTGKIQLYIKEDNLPSTTKETLGFKDLLEVIDPGDFVQAFGKLTKTQRGEISLEVSKIVVLVKSVRPLPDTWEGLQDTELRQRKRYLDMTMNPEIRKRFERRAEYWQAHRDFFREHGFFEVNIPVLELTTGGADAKPFVTHMDAIDQDFYLRISHELPLKRLIGGGFEKVYDIGPRFRNEGFSDEHLPEHVAMEFYWAYADYREGMDFVEEMFRYVAKRVWGKTKFNLHGFEVDLEKKWDRLDFATIIKERFGVDIFNTTKKEVNAILLKNGVDEKENVNRGIDALGKIIRKTIAGPAFMINEPKFLSPLAKSMVENPVLTERVHPWMAGSELGNGFSELNDPIDQLERFEVQQKMRDEGDDEAQMLDTDFVEMLEYGMPPTFGWGHSERNFWIFEDVSAREGVPFPPMREEKKTEFSKSKTTKTEVILINKEAKLEKWQELNTVAHLSGSLALREGTKLVLQDTIETKDGEKIKLNIQHAIMLKEIDTGKEILEVRDQAKKLGLKVVEFTREMIQTTNDKKVIAETSKKDLKDLEILGILIFGDKETVDSITKKYKLAS